MHALPCLPLTAPRHMPDYGESDAHGRSPRRMIEICCARALPCCYIAEMVVLFGPELTLPLGRLSADWISAGPDIGRDYWVFAAGHRYSFGLAGCGAGDHWPQPLDEGVTVTREGLCNNVFERSSRPGVKSLDGNGVDRQGERRGFSSCGLLPVGNEFADRFSVAGCAIGSESLCAVALGRGEPSCGGVEVFLVGDAKFWHVIEVRGGGRFHADIDVAAGSGGLGPPLIPLLREASRVQFRLCDRNGWSHRRDSRACCVRNLKGVADVEQDGQTEGVPGRRLPTGRPAQAHHPHGFEYAWSPNTAIPIRIRRLNLGQPGDTAVASAGSGIDLSTPYVGASTSCIGTVLRTPSSRRCLRLSRRDSPGIPTPSTRYPLPATRSPVVEGCSIEV